MKLAVVALVALSVCLYGEDVPQNLSPSHTVNIAHVESRGLSPDKWSHGYLPMFHSMRVPGNPVEVWMYDRNGEEIIQRTEILPADAYQIVPYQVTATPDGTLVLSAELWSSAAEAASVLCFVKSPGVLDKIVRTESVVADSLTVDESGEMWGFGSPPFLRFERAANYNVLEHWAPKGGRTLGVSIPRSSFATELNPAMYANEGASRVLATQTRLALYSAQTREWMEIARSSGEITEQYRLDSPGSDAAESAAAVVTEIVMTSSGRVYANFYAGGSSNLYQLDRKQRRWVAVPKSATPLGFGGLFGVEGEQLIVRSGPGLYGWFEAPDIVSGLTRAAALRPD